MLSNSADRGGATSCQVFTDFRRLILAGVRVLTRISGISGRDVLGSPAACVTIKIGKVGLDR